MSDLLGLLQQELALFIALASLLGLLAGSFINVVAYRLPKMLQADWQQQAKVILAEAQPAVAARPEPDSTSPRFNLLVPRSA